MQVHWMKRENMKRCAARRNEKNMRVCCARRGVLSSISELCFVFRRLRLPCLVAIFARSVYMYRRKSPPHLLQTEQTHPISLLFQRGRTANGCVACVTRDGETRIRLSAISAADTRRISACGFQ